MMKASIRPVVESLESRKLLAGDFSTVQGLPFVLEWAQNNPGLTDLKGVGTGFTLVYDNKIPGPDEYKPQLMDVVTGGGGVLRVTSDGSATSGSNFDSDNTLVNALADSFDFTNRGFRATVRLRGPLDNINTPSDQGGLLFGPDQDNYVKLVVAAQPGGTVVQMLDEQTINGQITHALGSSGTKSGVLSNLAGISTLDLRLNGDAISGKITGSYSINGGAFQSMPSSVTLAGDRRAAFFNDHSRLGLMTAHKNSVGPVTITYDRFEVQPVALAVSQPTVTNTRPMAGATNVPRDTFIALDVFLPNAGHGIDATTVNADTVKLTRAADGKFISSSRNVSGGGDSIVLQPRVLLDANTEYVFTLTSGVKDTSGAAFAPTSFRFTTGEISPNPPRDIGFQKVDLPTTTGQVYTGVTFGPDGNLYAGTFDGKIWRFGVAADGTLGAGTLIDTVRTNNGLRTITGLAFEPGSTPTNMALWVTHSAYATENAPDWSGKVSRLSGPNLTGYKDVVVNLPRAYRDHMTNQLTFGPDGAIYFAQGSNSGLGAPDNAWGLRGEHLLNGALLRLDPTRFVIGGAPALDAKTDSGGTFNPYAPDSPLTIIATGIRNAYDLVWHSNGNLYLPVNGGAAGGNTPGNGTIPALTNVAQTQDDTLIRWYYNAYYGQPNITRGQVVLNGGNPTAGIDPSEVPTYPVGTPRDPSWVAPAFVFGKSLSPDGIIEYKGNAFGGRLRGALLVARYSGGDDVDALTLDGNGNVSGEMHGIAGLSLFTDPVDLTQSPNPDQGFLYVAEYGGQKLTLLKPVAPGGGVVIEGAASGQRLDFNDNPGDNVSNPGHTLTIRNTGSSPLILQADALTITGPDASQFLITGEPSLPATIDPGKTRQVSVTFLAKNGAAGDVRQATLEIDSNDVFNPTIRIGLRGLVTAGTGGANEPSLQRILNLYDIPVTVGDPDPATDEFNAPVYPNDEVLVPRFVKANRDLPVSIEPVSVFGVSKDPAVRFGFYPAGQPSGKTELFTAPQSNAQTVQPQVLGSTSFDPVNTVFSFYTTWPSLGSLPVRDVYGEDVYNTFEPVIANRHKMRVYPLRYPDGGVVQDAAVIAFEEITASYDYNDFVAIVRNVRSANDGLSPQIGLANLDSGPRADWMVFNRVQDPINTDENPPKPNNKFHDVGTLRVTNSGAATLNVANLTLSGPWVLEGTPASFSVAPGASRDVKVRFVATGGRTSTGTLTLTSNDPDQPTVTVKLAGFWQSVSENQTEPSLQELVSFLGFDTKVVYPGQILANNGLRQAVGEEVMSGYWRKADKNQPVTVRQLSAYHTQGDVATFRWYERGKPTLTDAKTVFAAAGEEGQSVSPHQATNASLLAAGSFDPGTLSFGFRIDGEFSDDSLNKVGTAKEPADGNHGHHVRMYPARGNDGVTIPNTWLLTMDYQGINYDYNDNVYLITNIRPEPRPSAPTGVAAFADPFGVRVAWAPSPDAIYGYRVYRSRSPFDGFELLSNEHVQKDNTFIDTTVVANVAYFYRVSAINAAGLESGYASAATQRFS